MKIRYRMRPQLHAIGTYIVYGCRDEAAPLSRIFQVHSHDGNTVYLKHSGGTVDRYLPKNDPVWLGGTWRYATTEEIMRFNKSMYESQV